MLRILILSFLICLGNTTISEAQNDTLAQQFEKTNRYLHLKDSIIRQKKLDINVFRDSLKIANPKNKKEEFRLLLQLSKQYEYFVYDSAFQYANRAINIAYQLKDEEKIAEAKTRLSLILLLKGLYKETIDSLQSINPYVLQAKKRVEFYSVAYRAYYDLSNSRWGYFAPKYLKIGNSYVRKIEEEGDPDSFDYLLARALKSLNNLENDKAINLYKELVYHHNLNPHQAAISNCGLGIAYIRLHEKEKAKYHLLKAAVGDIQSVTMETLAAKVLAEVLFHEGDLEKANKFIAEAQKDAGYYGSNARRLEISYIKPDIEAAVLKKVVKEKDLVLSVSIIVSLLTLIIVAFAIIIYRQLRELRKARKVIMESNRSLRQVNDQLREVSKIKEEYVGYYFNFSSQFIERMDAMRKAISRQLLTKQYDTIEHELRQYNAKKERQNLFQDFDRIFLKLFPDFVNRYNLLFEDKDRIQLKDSNCLNTDLRIFALIRLGIIDNEKIASILNFSVNTIYTYKTKIKNRSLVPNEDFDSKIMEIKSV
ncbi:DUF6377 domain-containing protein [Ancylomarina longa]|uniref:Tetratricopeptide repeat protein n=1 Tax=Ancylomarina longa TaxID=2487017 RepID=A0A434AZ08_9BACT|nr:DUF6377 domain-containing protein [Ancylomarina longa]RUT79705.1 tetratricopeptide repeat protein [Ancylomarina longa]